MLALSLEAVPLQILCSRVLIHSLSNSRKNVHGFNPWCAKNECVDFPQFQTIVHSEWIVLAERREAIMIDARGRKLSKPIKLNLSLIL